MKNKTKINTLCIIPARKGSTGLKNKNIKLLNGIPLIKYPYFIAKKLKFIDDIVLTSDSKKYLNVIKDKKIIKIIRPKNLSTSKSSIIEVIKHALKIIKKKYDFILLLEPTSPFSDFKEIVKAYDILIKKNYDFVVPVISLPKYHPIFALSLDKKSKVVSKNFPKKINRQSFKEKFFISGNFYLAKTEKLLLNKSFISSKTMGFKIKTSIHTDIDNFYDFLFAETILKNGLFKKIK